MQKNISFASYFSSFNVCENNKTYLFILPHPFHWLLYSISLLALWRSFCGNMNHINVWITLSCKKVISYLHLHTQTHINRNTNAHTCATNVLLLRHLLQFFEVAFKSTLSPCFDFCSQHVVVVVAVIIVLKWPCQVTTISCHTVDGQYVVPKLIDQGL